MRESGSDVVEIDNDPVLFRFILDYLYGVSIEVPSSLIIPLLGLSSSYSMIGMRDKLAEMLGRHLCIENCCSIFAAAGGKNYVDPIPNYNHSHSPSCLKIRCFWLWAVVQPSAGYSVF